MLDYLFKDKKFYKTLLMLAMPIAAQNFVASAVNMVDTIMIGQLGETEIAAVGQANQLFFSLCTDAFRSQQRLSHIHRPVLGHQRRKEHKKGAGSVSDNGRHCCSILFNSCPVPA